MVIQTSRSTTTSYCGLLSLSAGKPSGSMVRMISGLSVFEYMCAPVLKYPAVRRNGARR